MKVLVSDTSVLTDLDRGSPVDPGRDNYPVNARISVLTVREVPDLRQRLHAM